MGKRGGRRPGAGRPRKPTAEHVLNGTFRPDRHGPRPAHVHALTAAAPEADWRPSPADVAGLGAVALEWMTAILTTYRLDGALEGRRVLLALQSLDRADRLEQAVRSDPGANAGLHRALDRELRQFSAQWQALNLERA